MALKHYQERVLERTEQFLKQLRIAQSNNQLKAGTVAWDEVAPYDASGKVLSYMPRRTGKKEDLPHFCLKVPTGGGKTLLATQVLAQAYKILLPERNGAGLALWVVPSDQIYRDLLKALRDRNHFYRQSLEVALSRRIEIWEKHEIPRLTPSQLRDNLNILVVKLQGTNRQDKESLKFFRDTSGNIVRHFPPEDRPEEHFALKQRCANLSMMVDDAKTGQHLIETSIANLVRLCEPVIILDENQKAASALAQETIEGFNPRLLVELSATPPAGANLLCRVSGQELLDEQMIKLPINVSAATSDTWQNCLTRAYERRERLNTVARCYYADSSETIRPIVLVQVERTGKDQRGSGEIHAEDVREYLTQTLGVLSDRVKIKSSTQNDIENINLMAEDCPVEWIITKSALQEGWDCPFAYILVSLSKMQSRTSLAQLVGRVLRQPGVRKTPYNELNESYVYCLHQAPLEVMRDIHTALMKEGYEGEVSNAIRVDGESQPSEKESVMRPKFRDCYLAPRQGQVLLPRFCVSVDEGDGNKTIEKLDYFKHLLPHVRVADFDYRQVKQWKLTDPLERAYEYFFRVTLQDAVQDGPLLGYDPVALSRDTMESDEATRAWLVANLDIDWLSAKQLRRIVTNACDIVIETLPKARGVLTLLRFEIRERLAAFIQSETDKRTDAVFKQWFDDGLVSFHVEPVDCVWEVPQRQRRKWMKTLFHEDGEPMQRSLFDPQPAEDNLFETEVARMIDQHEKVVWWLRNVAKHDAGFSIQGSRRQRIYPDFVVQRVPSGELRPTTLVLESKGRHLKGNTDTEYKKTVAWYFSEVGKLVDWQQVTWAPLSSGFEKHCFTFELLHEGDYSASEWRDQLESLLDALS